MKLGARFKRWIASGAVLLVAAALFVHFWTRRPELPPYEAKVVGAAVEHWPPLVVPQGRASSGFELVLRPAFPPDGRVVAYAFTFDRDGAEPSPLDAAVELGQDGTVRMKGTTSSLGDATEVRVVVGAPTDIGKFDDAMMRAATQSRDEFVGVVVIPITRN